MEDIDQQLRAFVEGIANSTSSLVHNTRLPEEARKLTKQFGGKLNTIRKHYAEGSAALIPGEMYVNGEWISPTLNRDTDKWEFPKVQVYVRRYTKIDGQVRYFGRLPDMPCTTPQYAYHYKTEEEGEAAKEPNEQSTIVLVDVVGLPEQV